jgi:membrane protein DedA with SNARE-associated domain
VPGGRTALTLSCGITRQRRLWFMAWVVIAVSIWATYAALLGRIGGEAFKDDHNKAFLMAFGLAMASFVLIELTRHLVRRRRAPVAG